MVDPPDRVPVALLDQLPVFLVAVDYTGTVTYMSRYMREQIRDAEEVGDQKYVAKATGTGEAGWERLLNEIRTGEKVAWTSRPWSQKIAPGKIFWKVVHRNKKGVWLAGTPLEGEEKGRDFFRIAFEASLVGVAIIDRKGDILLANRKALEIFHLPPDQGTKGLNMYDLMTPETRRSVDLEGRFTREGSLLNKIYEMRRPDGSRFYLEASTAAVFDREEEKPAYVVSTFRDITEELRRKKELEEALKKAEESDRLKTAFLTNMSHEIRTPLNAIVGFSGMLADPRVPYDRKKEYLHYIEQSSESLLHLINDILDISKIEAGQIMINREKFSLAAFLKEIEAVAREQQHKFGKKHLMLNFLRAGCEADPWLEGDPHRIRQVLVNLVSNALKFTEEGYVNVSCGISGKKVVFRVEDTGPGIPLEEQTTIFERFRQVDNSITRRYGGAGLGLAITRSLVEQMEGTLRLESTLGQGTRFTVSFPGVFYRKEFSGTRKDTGKVSGKRPDWHGYTILVAEDEPTNYDLLKALLEPTGVLLRHAWTGSQAVDMALAHRPDLLLMDLRMPEMDGIRALREIRTHLPHIPAIAQTAFAMANERKHCLESGFDDYLAKPIQASLLLEKIGNLLREKEKGADL